MYRVTETPRGYMIETSSSEEDIRLAWLLGVLAERHVRSIAERDLAEARATDQRNSTERSSAGLV